jgi:hypothetical protein
MSSSWKKLTKNSIEQLFPFDDDCMILVKTDTKDPLDRFNFNPEDDFSKEEIEQFAWYDASDMFKIREMLCRFESDSGYIFIDPVDAEIIFDFIHQALKKESFRDSDVRSDEIIDYGI